MNFEPPALDEVFRLTKGYPFFVQAWGYQSWNLATASPITKLIVKKVTTTVIPRLDMNSFRVRYDRLARGQKNFLRAMAELGARPQRTGDIADTLKVSVTSPAPVRAKLIKKGMIYSPAHSEMAFTVPLVGEFMIRAIPTFKA